MKLKNIIGVMLVVIVCTSCRKEPFSFESKWLSPLISTSLTINDLIADSIKSVDSEGKLSLVIEHEEIIDDLISSLEIPDSLSDLTLSLSDLKLEDKSFTDTITLAELYPPIVLLNGQTTTLTAQDIVSDNFTELDVREQFFTSAKFQTGYLDITIYNDLPVEVEEISFELLNGSDESVIISGLLNNIPANGSASKSFDISGKRVEGLMKAKLKRVKTLASSGPVLIDAYKGIRLELLVRDLKPMEATAIFPSQNLVEQDDETTYDFGGPEISFMSLKGGVVKMEVFSSVEEQIILEYEVPQSKHSSTGTPLVKQFIIPAATKDEPSRILEEIDLADYEVICKGKDVNNPPLFNTFHSTLKARIEYTGIERTLSLSDSIYIRFGLVGLKPKLAIGDFGTTTIDIKDPFDISIFKGMSGILSLDDATLDLSFENAFGMEAKMNINRFAGVGNTTVDLISTELTEPIFLNKAEIVGARPIPSVEQRSLNKNNSNFKLFLENIPSTILPDLTVITSPYGSNGDDFVFDESFLKVRLNLNIPLKVGYQDFTVRKKEAFQLKADRYEQVKEAKINLLFENLFPWNAAVRLEFLSDDGDVLHTLWNGEFRSIEAGEIENPGDKVNTSKRSEVSDLLDRWAIDRMAEATYVRVTAKFSTKDGARYPIYADYSLDFKLVAEFIYESN